MIQTQFWIKYDNLSKISLISIFRKKQDTIIPRLTNLEFLIVFVLRKWSCWLSIHIRLTYTNFRLVTVMVRLPWPWYIKKAKICGLKAFLSGKNRQTRASWIEVWLYVIRYFVADEQKILLPISGWFSRSFDCRTLELWWTPLGILP